MPSLETINGGGLSAESRRGLRPGEGACLTRGLWVLLGGCARGGAEVGGETLSLGGMGLEAVDAHLDEEVMLTLGEVGELHGGGEGLGGAALAGAALTASVRARQSVGSDCIEAATARVAGDGVERHGMILSGLVCVTEWGRKKGPPTMAGLLERVGDMSLGIDRGPGCPRRRGFLIEEAARLPTLHSGYMPGHGA